MESSPLTQSTSDECTSPESSTLAEQPSPKRIKLETTQSCAISTNHIFRSGKRWEFLCPVQDDEHLVFLFICSYIFYNNLY
jgi:hypothetical protein